MLLCNFCDRGTIGLNVAEGVVPDAPAPSRGRRDAAAAGGGDAAAVGEAGGTPRNDITPWEVDDDDDDGEQEGGSGEKAAPPSPFGRWAESGQSEREKKKDELEQQHQRRKKKRAAKKKKKPKQQRKTFDMHSRLNADGDRFWFLGRLHACLNHACPSPGNNRAGPNAAVRFEARPGRVAVVVVATREVRKGDEVTCCYATDECAAGEGFASLRAFLRARRLFDCACATCAARGPEKKALAPKSYPLSVCTTRG